MANIDKNGTILKMQDWVKDEKGVRGQLQNIHGVAILKFENTGKVLSKIDLSKYEKFSPGGYHV